MDLNEIIKKHGNIVKYIIKRITNEENEDLEQEVYYRVLKNSEKYEEQGNLRAWIKTISANLSKDYLKSSQKKLSDNSTSDETVLTLIKSEKRTPEEILLQKERQKRIYDAICGLKPKFKEVIVLSEIEGKTYEDIAKIINCPLGTVKSRIYNAKKELAEKLKDLL